MSFREQFLTAVYRFKKYPRLVLEDFSRVFCFFLIFIILVSIISTLPLVKMYKDFGGISGFIEKNVPDFYIEDGQLYCEAYDYTNEMLGVKIYYSVNEKAENIDVKGYTTYIVADQDKLISFDGRQKRLINFNDGAFNDFGKWQLVQFFKNPTNELYMVGIFALTMFIVYLILSVMKVLLTVGLIFIVNLMTFKADLSFLSMTKLAVYVRVFPCVLFLVLYFSNFAVSALIYFGILITYIYLALKNIKKSEAIIIAEIKEGV